MEEKVYLEWLKDRISFRLHNKVTAGSFKQSLKKIENINADLDKINKSLKANK